MSTDPIADNDAPEKALARTRTLFVIEGAVLLILGGAAVALPLMAAVTITLILGSIFVFSGLIGLVGALAARNMPGVVWSVISSLLAIAAGAVLIRWPVSGLVSLSLVLSVFFIADGFVSIMFAVEHRRRQTARWGWTLTSGLVTLLLAVAILVGLPASSAVLGILVGIDMIFAGAAMIAIGVSANRLV